MTLVSIASTTEPQELDVLASSIRAHLNTINSHTRGILTEAFAVGANLLEAKAQVPKGKWESWLENNCALSLRQAQLYMRLANHRGEIESHLVEIPDLSLRAAERLIAESPASSAGAVLTEARRAAPPSSPRLNILEHWEQSSKFEQKAVLAAMKRDELLAILPDGIGVVPAPVKPKNGFAAIPLPDGDDGLGIPDFLRRPLISTGNGAATNGAVAH
jgi:hypothetical protein